MISLMGCNYKKDLAPAANHALSHFLAMDVTFILCCNAHGLLHFKTQICQKPTHLKNISF